MHMSMQTIHATLFSAGTSLNAFWILNIVKESSPAVKAFLGFYPVTGPVLGVYIASILVFVILLAVLRNVPVTQTGAFMKFAGWYFMLSVIAFFFGVFPPVYVPIVEWITAG